MKLLQTRFRIDTGPLSRSALAEKIGAYDVVFVRLGHQVDRQMLNRAQNLAAIVSPTTGLDHIDLDAAAEQRIAVLSLRGERAFLKSIHATAELAWGLILALARHIHTATRHVADGGWERDQFKGIELAGRTLGVVGFGRLGARVAHYGSAFGMRVIACDHTVELPASVGRRDLNGLCSEADVISIHVPSSPENKGLVGERQFAVMKTTALFINTSRGGIVDERALLGALSEGRIAGAALDVLAAEYDEESVDIAEQLRRFAREQDRLIMTPHIGGATYDSMRHTEDFMVARLLEAVDRGEIRFRARMRPAI